MPKSRYFQDSFWSDPDVEMFDPLKRLVFVALFTLPEVTTSGIYTITPRKLEKQTGVPHKLIAHYLGIKRLDREALKAEYITFMNTWLEMAEEGFAFRNAPYDPKHHTVFVVKSLEKNGGGRPEWVDNAIIGDHKNTYSSEVHWDAFRRKYAARIDSSARLSDYFVATETTSEPPTDDDEPLEPQGAPEKDFDDERYEKEIEEMMQRYSMELDSEDREHVFTVLAHVNRSLKNNAPLTPKRRWKHITRLHKEPPELVAQACFQFIKADCIERGFRFEYLLGIVNGSARSWYIEYSSELEKKEGLNFGSRRDESAGSSESEEPAPKVTA